MSFRGVRRGGRRGICFWCSFHDLFLRLLLNSPYQKVKADPLLSARVGSLGMSILIGCSLLGGDDFREIGNGGEFAQQLREQRQPVATNLFLFGHYQHAVEEFIDLGPELGDSLQRFTISSNFLVPLGFLRRATGCVIYLALSFFFK